MYKVIYTFLTVIAVAFANSASGQEKLDSSIPKNLQSKIPQLEKSVVKLKVYIDGNYAGHGTGWYVKKNRIVTNYHVVNAFLQSQGQNVELKAEFKDRKKEQFIVTEMLSFDRHNDAIVLIAETNSSSLTLAKPSNKVSVGEKLLVLGNPGDRRFTTMYGPVLSLNKKFDEPLGVRTNLELGLEVKGGASGSPVFNNSGEVVSMVMGGAEGVQSGLCLTPKSLRKVIDDAKKAKPQTLKSYAKSYLKALGKPGDEINSVNGKLECTARKAQTHGKEIQFETESDTEGNIGFWTNKSDHLSWNVVIPETGKYQVEIHSACPADTADTKVSLDVLKSDKKATEKQLVAFKVKSTSDFADYCVAKIGVVELVAGKLHLGLKPVSTPKFAVMNFKKLVLKKVKSN